MSVSPGSMTSRMMSWRVLCSTRVSETEPEGTVLTISRGRLSSPSEKRNSASGMLQRFSNARTRRTREMPSWVETEKMELDPVKRSLPRLPVVEARLLRWL